MMVLHIQVWEENNKFLTDRNGNEQKITEAIGGFWDHKKIIFTIVICNKGGYIINNKKNL